MPPTLHGIIAHTTSICFARNAWPTATQTSVDSVVEQEGSQAFFFLLEQLLIFVVVFFLWWQEIKN